MKLPCGLTELDNWLPDEEFLLGLIRDRAAQEPVKKRGRSKKPGTIPASIMKMLEGMSPEKREELKKLLGGAK